MYVARRDYDNIEAGEVCRVIRVDRGGGGIR